MTTEKSEKKGRKANPAGMAALQQIQKFAKEIKAKHPDKKYSDCIKEGSAMYRANKSKK